MAAVAAATFISESQPARDSVQPSDATPRHALNHAHNIHQRLAQASCAAESVPLRARLNQQPLRRQ